MRDRMNCCYNAAAVLLCCAATCCSAGHSMPPRRLAAEPPPPTKKRGAAAQRHEQQSAQYYTSIALAGAVSCSLTHSAVVPLDVIKTKLQSDTTLTGARDAVRSVLAQSKGLGCVSALCNGLSATAVGYFAQGAVKFGGYELIKRSAFCALDGLGERGRDIADTFRLPIMLGAAASAELVASAALCPLETLKLRMQTDSALAALGFRRGLQHLAAGAGWRTLFKGLGPIAMRQVPYTACKLVSFELGSAFLQRAATAHAARTGSAEPPRNAIVLAAGLMAGATAAVVSQPFDLLLTRVCGSASVTALAECVVDDSLRGQLTYLIELGPAAFTGIGPRLAMVSVMTACQFFIFDGLRRSFNAHPPNAQ